MYALLRQASMVTWTEKSVTITLQVYKQSYDRGVERERERGSVRERGMHVVHFY